MLITARCHPLLEPLLPKPQLARAQMPNWLKTMPSMVNAKTLGHQSVRTLKHCPPFIDAMSHGIILPLVTDITVKNGQISWDWDPPVIADAPITRSPIGVHVSEQAQGTPLENDGALFIKFNNFWLLGAPAGWSLIFTHPFNRTDLPFHTLTGLVDCDAFSDGYVHFPAIIDPNFEGVILRGTPIVQIIPVPRQTLTLDIRAMSFAEIEKSARVQKSLSTEPGIYRKTFRKSRT